VIWIDRVAIDLSGRLELIRGKLHPPTRLTPLELVAQTFHDRWQASFHS
jgi:hypothetical protein